MSSFRVQQVPNDEYLSLKKELEEDIERTYWIHSAIHLQLRKGQLKNTKLRVFRAEDSKFKSFIFVTPIFSENNFQSTTAYWNSDEICDEEVGQLFSNVPKWDWNKPFFYLSSSFEMGEHFCDLFMKKKIIANTTLMVECLPVKKPVLMTVTKEDLKLAKLPSGYKFGYLPPSAANLMHSLWDYNIIENADGVRERIETYEGVGVFYTNGGGNDHQETYTNGGGNAHQETILVSWIQQYMFGALGMTFTLPEHRKLGLGSAITSELVRQILKDGRTPYVFTKDDNFSSIHCLENIGFKITGNVGTFLFVPKDSIN